MNLRRDEMAFRMAYLGLLRRKKLKTVFRPGNRIYPAFRGYKIGEEVMGRVIEIPGNDGSLVAPKFIKEFFPIKITGIKVCSIEELTNGDFKGSSPDVQNPTELGYHLGIIYNRPAESFKEVSRISFEYLP